MTVTNAGMVPVTVSSAYGDVEGAKELHLELISWLLQRPSRFRANWNRERVGAAISTRVPLIAASRPRHRPWKTSKNNAGAP